MTIRKFPPIIVNRVAAPVPTRVFVEIQDDLPLAQIAEQGGSFDFLADEPDLYSEMDIQPCAQP